MLVCVCFFPFVLGVCVCHLVCLCRIYLSMGLLNLVEIPLIVLEISLKTYKLLDAQYTCYQIGGLCLCVLFSVCVECAWLLFGVYVQNVFMHISLNFC